MGTGAGLLSGRSWPGAVPFRSLNRLKSRAMVSMVQYARRVSPLTTTVRTQPGDEELNEAVRSPER